MRESRRGRGGIVAAAGGDSPSIACAAWATCAAAISSRTRFSSCARYWKTPRLTVALRIPPPEIAIPSAGALSAMSNLRRREITRASSSWAISAGICEFMACLPVPMPLRSVQAEILQRKNSRAAEQRVYGVRVVEHHVRLDVEALEFEVDAAHQRRRDAAADAAQRRRRLARQRDAGAEPGMLG